MATQFKIKRGLKANLPSSAQEGEPLFCTDTGEFFIGKGSGQPLGRVVTNEGFINVKYPPPPLIGAKGDGTNDTVAIQSVIDSANTNKIPVFFPKPDSFYGISNTLKAYSNTVLLGENGVVIKLTNNANCSILINDDSTNGNSNIRLKDIIFDGNKSNQTVTNSVIKFTKVSNSKFENVTVQNSKDTGISNGYGTAGWQNDDCTNNVFIKCVFNNNDKEGVQLLRGSGNIFDTCIAKNNGNSGISIVALSSDNTVSDCIATDNGTTNISINGLRNKVIGCQAHRSLTASGIVLGHYDTVDDSERADDSIVIGNHCYDNTQAGIGGENSDNVVISGNICKNNTTKNIFISNGNQVSITNNTCIGGGSQDSIVITSNNNLLTYHHKITDNTIISAQRCGIAAYSFQDSIIKDNIIKNPNQGNFTGTLATGIMITRSNNTNYCINNDISDNIITCNDGKMNYGIYSDTASNINNKIDGNKISGFTTEAIYSTGANRGINNINNQNQQLLKGDGTVFRSPNGTKYLITVDDTGVIKSTTV